MLLAAAGLIGSMIAGFHFEVRMIDMPIKGGTFSRTYREYPLVSTSIGLAIFAGMSALGAAFLQMSEMRAGRVEPELHG